jgi:hypothetical protein
MNPSNALERANLAGKAKALVSVTSHTLDGIELFLELPDRRELRIWATLPMRALLRVD